MKKPPVPPEEAGRWKSLRGLRILDTPPEERFDRITRIAKRHFEVSIALVSLVDAERQWFKSRQGLNVSETPRSISFCGHAILGDQIFVVPDALKDPDFADNPLVCGQPGIRFYAGAPLHAPDGARIGTLCIIDNQPRSPSAEDLSILRDLADCVETELALTTVREHEHFLKEITDATPALVAYWDKDLLCRFANHSYLEWFGKRPEAVIGNTIQSLLGPELFARNECYIRGALAGEIQRFERTLTRADGSTGHTWAIYVPDRNREGAVAGFTVLVTDVTPLKNAERKIREAQQHLQAILDNVQDGIVTLDEEGILVSTNNAMTGMFHYSADEMIGQPMRKLIPEFQALGSREGGPISARCELDGRNKAGQRFPIELLTREMTGGDGAQVVGVVRDVTERIEATQALEKARRAAEAANAAKDRFLATVSHEIRTPITAVLGMAELLMDSSLNSDQRGWLQQLIRSARTLLDLMNDILDFSKIESGHVELDAQDFCLSTLVEEVCMLFAPLASERGNVIHMQAKAEADEAVYRGDASKYRQVLMNLIGNANKFTSNGNISVAVSERRGNDGSVVIETSVSDTGIGIATANRERLFAPFVQEDASTSRKFGGTGLGLSICKKLTELMGGRIWMESELGKGSTFTFAVPLEAGNQSQMNAVTVAARSAEKPARRSLRVLVTEDNDAIRMLITAMLSRNGHSVTEANDGRAAVAAVRLAKPDIILMDMQMPVMDGPSAMRIIRMEESASARIPIIALTADALKENRAAYLAAGAESLLVKPIDWQVLFSEMDRLTAPSRHAPVCGETSLR